MALISSMFRSLRSNNKLEKPLSSALPVGGASVDSIIMEHHSMAKRLHSLYGLLRPGFEVEAIRPLERALNIARTNGASHETLTLILYCGVHGYQSSLAVLFCKDIVPSQRRKYEPAWHFGAYIACLCFPLAKHFALNPNYLIDSILDVDHTHSFQLIPDLRKVILDSLNEEINHAAPRFRDLVRNTYWRLVQHRNGIDPQESGKILIEYFIRSLPILSKLPNWQPNEPKSRLWSGADGTFLIWPAAFPNIEAQLVAENLPMPIPDQLSLAKDLASAGLIAIRLDPVHPYIQIRVPETQRVFDAVELKNLTLWSKHLGTKIKQSSFTHRIQPAND